MSPSNSEAFNHAVKTEEANGGNAAQLERLRTVGGHVDDRTQPSLPVVHRRFANPAPLGLLSFATGIFLISIYGVKVRGVATPNVLIGVLMFFGSVCQFISGIMEFMSGNTFGATVFPSYGAFNLFYAMIYLPGTGILAAYTDPTTPRTQLPIPQRNRHVSLGLVHFDSNLHCCSNAKLLVSFPRSAVLGFGTVVTGLSIYVE